MTRPRVAVLSQLPPPVHGSTVMTAVLLDALREGHDVELLDRRYSRTVEDVGGFSPRKALALPGLVARTIALVTRRRPDVAVMFLTNRRMSFLSDLAVLGVFRAARVPVVHYVHTSGYRDLAASRGLGRAVRWALGAAVEVVTLGPSLDSDVAWATRHAPIPIRNVPPRPPDLATPRGAHAVCFLSNLIPEKGASDAVAIGERLCAADPAVTVTIAGAEADPAYAARLRQTVAGSAHADRITLAGPLYGEDKWRLLAGSALLLFPSTYPLEAQPLTILEARCAGTRVVAYDVGGVADLAEPGGVTVVACGDLDAATAAARAALAARPQPGRVDLDTWAAEAARYARAWSAVLARSYRAAPARALSE